MWVGVYTQATTTSCPSSYPLLAPLQTVATATMTAHPLHAESWGFGFRVSGFGFRVSGFGAVRQRQRPLKEATVRCELLINQQFVGMDLRELFRLSDLELRI